MEGDFQTRGMVWVTSFRGEENGRLAELKAHSERERVTRWGIEGGGAMPGLSVNFGNRKGFKQ